MTVHRCVGVGTRRQRDRLRAARCACPTSPLATTASAGAQAYAQNWTICIGNTMRDKPTLSRTKSALGLLSLWDKSRAAWQLLITAIARYPLVSPGRGPARLKHGTVRVMATKAERRAARERVSAYHESQLAGLLGHVGAEIDRYRAGEIDAYAADETIHHYHRAAAELWKFCFARGGGAHVEFAADLLDRMTADAETIDWWERAAPRRHQ